MPLIKAAFVPNHRHRQRAADNRSQGQPALTGSPRMKKPRLTPGPLAFQRSLACLEVLLETDADRPGRVGDGIDLSVRILRHHAMRGANG